MEYLHRLWSWLRRGALARNLASEMELHLELKAREYAAQGMTPEQARRHARLAFGSPDLAAERSRERWGFPLVETTFHDLRYALRQMIKHPGFTAVVVLTLALGIGANSAIFSVVNAFLLKSLPVRHPEELVRVGIHPNGEFEQPAYEYLRDHQKALAALIAWDDGNIAATIDGNTSVIPVDYLSGNFYSTLGVDVLAGRALTPADDVPGAPAVAVISYRYWRDRFALDPSVVGRSVQLKDIACTIVGVTRPGFHGLRTGGTVAAITVAASWHAHLTLKDNTTFALFGRLGPGVDRKQAEADLNVAYHQWLIPEANKINDPQQRKDLLRRTIAVSPARQGALEFDRRFVVQLRLVEAVVVLVLLIACVNLANLLLARGTSRRREIEVRLALGARRGRIVRQLLTENLLLAILGGGLGLLISVPLMRVFTLILRRNADAAALGIGVDNAVLAFTAILTILTGVLFGLAPALRSSAAKISPGLHGQTPSPAATRLPFRRVLIVPQVALSLALLILTGLLLRSLQRLDRVDLGFERSHLLTFWMLPTLSGFDDQRELDLYDRVLAGIQQLPGVRAASLTRLTVWHHGRVRGLMIDGVLHTDAPFVFNTAAPRFFETLGLPILAGRDFTPHDGPRAQQVAIIDQAMAQKYFPNENPIGHRIGLENEEPGMERTIVGVVKSVKAMLRDPSPAEAVYLPYAQAPEDLRGQAEIKVSTWLDPAVMIPAIRNQVHAVAEDLPPVDIVSFDEALDDAQNREERSLTQLLGGFGALAFALAVLGLYGTVTYSVSQRMREMAIRFALGARPRGVMWMIVRESLRYVLAGVVFGAALAIAASRAVESFLFEVHGFDPPTYAIVITAMILTAVAAAYLPARRTRHIEPMAVLRSE